MLDSDFSIKVDGISVEIVSERTTVINGEANSHSTRVLAEVVVVGINLEHENLD